ncbi:hypothetical protein KIN20_036157 [Parelaphostrongylus tenuis]|uniref:Uncharacterized protein n=1 Tax=Parelaphostrongylus tenuis TaxID=148309 RepID=A0AAD5WLG2_PARTN|nr:hypothetical protein KIN20_036157 [Parelaphostrongylus tenuis]
MKTAPQRKNFCHKELAVPAARHHALNSTRAPGLGHNIQSLLRIVVIVEGVKRWNHSVRRYSQKSATQTLSPS